MLPLFIWRAHAQTSRFVWLGRLYFSGLPNRLAAPGKGLFFMFCSLWSNVILPFYGVCVIASLSRRSLNGSLPSNVEIKNNTLFFKGPVTYDLAGTYVCDATNSIGTRTGIVDVNITGRWPSRLAAVTLAWLASIQYPS